MDSNSKAGVKEEEQAAGEPARLGVLRLKPERRVHWDGNVVDNEHLNRKKSNKCCIFHAQNEAATHSPCSPHEDTDTND